MWWSQEQISSTVDQAYVEKELGSKRYQDLLHRVLAFGDGLTDDTYLDWVLERSPRFFLILNDIGVPERIFEVIDRSFDDDDLPLSQDALWELNLFGSSSETLDKKFYRQQFHFLIQELEPGGHVDYGSWDVVPLESAIRKPSLPAATPSSERVFRNGQIYTRKKIPTSGENGIDRIRFIMHLKNIAAIQHQHLVTVWATYSQHDFNFVLLKPSCDVTLRHVLEDKDIAKHFKCLEKHERRQTLVTWIHCLLSALAYLHSRGFMHKSVRPSAISIDHRNVIYLNDYSALRVLDVDESPTPYSGEIYEYAPPENWQRKPTLHETAPLKTLPPGGGRTSRKLPKAAPVEAESRRPSLVGQDPGHRPHSRSQQSSSGSSTNLRPRNALITTFAPPDTTPLALPDRYFPGDVFSMTAVILSILSCLLGHSARSFASHRCKLNRQAGRGNAPPDASFHKNLKQVEKWVDQLAKEAGQKEKKDHNFWGSVVELVHLCKKNLAREPDDRMRVDEFERKALGWIEFGIGKRRKCECSEQDRSFEEPTVPHPVISAQRDSMLSWSKISERISSGLNSDEISLVEHQIRPRRSLSKRLSLDRAPELQRSRSTRPSSAFNRRCSTLAPTEEEPPLSPTSPPRHKHSDRTRSAARHTRQKTNPQLIQPRPSTRSTQVVHQGRSSYRIKPPKPSPIPATGRRYTHPSIREEPGNGEDEEIKEGDIADDENGQEGVSAYTLKPRRRTHPIPARAAGANSGSSTHRLHEFPVPPSPASIAQPPTPTTATDVLGGGWVPVLHGIPVDDDGYDAMTLYNRHEVDDNNKRLQLNRHDSYLSEVWGLGNALENTSIAGSDDGVEVVEMRESYETAGSRGDTKSRYALPRMESKDSDVLGTRHSAAYFAHAGAKKARGGNGKGESGSQKKKSLVCRLDWPLPKSPTASTVGQAV